MTDYYKKFDQWNAVAKEIQLRPHQNIKPGAVYWCSLGVNIGSEEDGKGPRFTRPVLVILQCNPNLALVAPFTTKYKKRLSSLQYIIAGSPEYLLIDQIRAIDTRRIEEFIDEIPPYLFDQICTRISQLFTKNELQ